MTTIHNLGFPRIGAQRELKFALESYWRGESSLDALQQLGAQLRQRHWENQKGLDLVPVGDFSFYDQVLDMGFTLGHLPERVRGFQGDALDNYFRVARGRSAPVSEASSTCCGGVAAGEMTKWFDTNYHYIVQNLPLLPRSSSTLRACWHNWPKRKPKASKPSQSSLALSLIWRLAKPKTAATNWPCCHACCRSMPSCWRRWQPKGWSGFR